MKVITTRIGNEEFENIRLIEEEEKTERAAVTRKLLALAIKEWKTKKALELLKTHKISIRKAASLAGVTYIEILDLASKEGIDSGYSLEELRKDLRK